MSKGMIRQNSKRGTLKTLLINKEALRSLTKREGGPCLTHRATHLGLSFQSPGPSVDLTDGVTVHRPHGAENLLKASHQLGLLSQAEGFQLFRQHLQRPSVTSVSVLICSW